ncbi:MAG TPA: zinc-ribbon domain-containing protein [Fimbriimonadaceae bacterium]|nr:zinc-ribbon domain-containing protein [Fimbriimonadaceae bacterium]
MPEETRCPECEAEMPADAEVCPSCGKKVTPQYTPDEVEGESGLYYCYRHRHETTRLRCGRCGRAVCTRCVVIGPAGPRCPDCAKNRIPVSARAVAYEARASLRGVFNGPSRYVWLILAFSIVWGAIRSCAAMTSRPRVVPIERQQAPPPNDDN